MAQPHEPRDTETNAASDETLLEDVSSLDSAQTVVDHGIAAAGCPDASVQTVVEPTAGSESVGTERTAMDSRGSQRSTELPTGAARRRANNRDKSGDTVGGRFTLEKKLGRGSFGVVWEAHDSTFDRDIALKILLIPTFEDKEKERMILARFELEKVVLARMEHPNIAKMFSGGTLKDGRPFLEMELVRGKSLTAYCDDGQLSLEKRLQMFVQICRAVHHAHEQLVLHRDLKPSNIMVVEQDGVAMPKVIDFGIAKVLAASEFSFDPTATLVGTVKGTPEYMSPEQTRGESSLTTRSDVFTLGVILYELLAGDTPLTHEHARKLHSHELAQAIREKEPIRLSDSLTRRTDRGTSIATKCGTRVTRLCQQLCGDLDIIALHALEKEPARRYGSAAELADDIERYLRSEPIAARPASAGYRLAKFTRRHKAGVAAAAVALLALVVTAVVSTRSYYVVRDAFGRESAERKIAVAARVVADEKTVEANAARAVAVQKKTEADTARDSAITARTKAEELINYMLFDLREQLEPFGRSRLLGSVSEKAEAYFANQPALTDNADLERNRGVMFSNRGRLLLAQGEVAGAVEKFRLGRDIMAKRASEQADEARQFDLATASSELGLALRLSGEPDAAQALFEVSLPMLRKKTDAEGTRLLAANLEQLGELELRAGNIAGALQLFSEQESALRGLLRTAKDEKRTKRALATACEKVGVALQQSGRLPEARQKFEEEVALFQTLSSGNLDDLTLRRSYVVGLEKLATILLALKLPAEALPHSETRLRESELLVQVDARDPELRRDVTVAHQVLSEVLLQLGRGPEAIQRARDGLRLTLALGPESLRDTDLAESYRQLGRALLPGATHLPEARANLVKSAELFRKLIVEGRAEARVKGILAEIEGFIADIDRAQKR